MGASSNNRSRTGKKIVPISKSSSGSGDLDRKLTEILTSIARLLLRNGYGFVRLNKLTKLAFVNAARSLDVRPSSRISIARIAAVTGLTRTEVSQLLRTVERSNKSRVEPLNRAERVAKGWLSDQDFCDSRGRPRRLQFVSTSKSFSNLVKKYSGDIPARAMLNEMKRLRMVRHDSSDTVTLSPGKRTTPRSTLTAIRAITPWVNFFAEINAIEGKSDLTSTARQLRLNFDSLPQSLAASREIESRRNIFIEGLRQLGGRSKASARYQLDVSIGVAIAAAKPVGLPTLRGRQR